MTSAAFASAAAVALTIEGVRHLGFRAMKLSMGIEAGAAQAALELADRWGDWEEASLPRLLIPGAPFGLELGGEPVMRGFLDEIAVDYDQRDHALTATGRCPIGDLVDCAAQAQGPFEFAGITLAEAAERLARPFGVTVRAEVDTGPPFPRFVIQPGEAVWEAIERAARMRGVLVTGDGNGALLLTRAGAGGKAGGPIVAGKDGNVLSLRGTFDWRGRFSETEVKGLPAGDLGGDAIYRVNPAAPGGVEVVEGNEGLFAARHSARVADTKVQRYRPRIIIAEGETSAGPPRTRAEWAVRVAAGRSTQLLYNVAGWRDAAGGLWRPNTSVNVVDPFLGLDREMLISAVTYSLTAQAGSLTELTVVPADAFALQPQEARRGAGDSAGGLTEGVVQRSDDAGRTWRRDTERPRTP